MSDETTPGPDLRERIAAVFAHRNSDSPVIRRVLGVVFALVLACPQAVMLAGGLLLR